MERAAIVADFGIKTEMESLWGKAGVDAFKSRPWSRRSAKAFLDLITTQVAFFKEICPEEKKTGNGKGKGNTKGEDTKGGNTKGEDQDAENPELKTSTRMYGFVTQQRAARKHAAEAWFNQAPRGEQQKLKLLSDANEWNQASPEEQEKVAWYVWNTFYHRTGSAQNIGPDGFSSNFHPTDAEITKRKWEGGLRVYATNLVAELKNQWESPEALEPKFMYVPYLNVPYLSGSDGDAPPAPPAPPAAPPAALQQMLAGPPGLQQQQTLLSQPPGLQRPRPPPFAPPPPPFAGSAARVYVDVIQSQPLTCGPFEPAFVTPRVALSPGQLVTPPPGLAPPGLEVREVRYQ